MAAAAGSPLGIIAGNFLSGLISEIGSWKWVFASIAVLSVLVTVLAFIFLPPAHPFHIRCRGEATEFSMDWAGAFLITVGSGALVLTLSEGDYLGWLSPWILTFSALSMALLLGFVLLEQHLEAGGKTSPMIRPSILRHTGLGVGMLIIGLNHSSYNGFLIYSTFFFQEYQGLSPLQTAIRFSPDGVACVVTAITMPFFLSKFSTKVLLVAGTVLVSLASLLLAIPASPDTNYFALAFPAVVISVVGANVVWPTLMLFTSLALPETDQALGGALINAAGRLGRAITLPVATAIQTTAMARERGTDIANAGVMRVGDNASLIGIRAGAWLNCGVGIAAVLFVMFGFRDIRSSQQITFTEKSNTRK
jgi:predicted MFS family arabinose efflux permease